MGVIDVDVVVVGAGFAGMYMLHRLRELGLSSVVIEAGTDVGGTWYWNRYPGARCDVPSMEYSFSFDPDLEQEWEWSEVMAAQPEILDYANHVADRFDLRSDIRFETRVAAAVYDDTSGDWTVTTEPASSTDPDTADDARYECRFVVMATGCLSSTNTPDIAGLADFEGEVLHTGAWPKGSVDFRGRRVGVIGTGSSGVQSIPVIAETAEHLTVLQRTPTFTIPAKNRPLRDDIQQAYKDNYPEIRDRQRRSPGGFSGFSPKKEVQQTAVGGTPDTEPKKRAPRKGLAELEPGERVEAFDRFGRAAFQTFPDVYRDLHANDLAREQFGRKVAEIVTDPKTAAALAPSDYPIGCKRQVLDTGYFETFNNANVELVDLRAEPLGRVTPAGVEIGDRTIDLDVLVLATGFDAMTGALDRIDIRGRDGQALKEKWSDGPQTYLGLQMNGFPNLFTITGPGSPSVLSNVLVSIEHHVDWISDCLTHMAGNGYSHVEPTVEAETTWGEHVAEVATGTMYTAPTCSSWYVGANIDGKPRGIMPYVAGVGRYRDRCDEIVAAGYEGFVFTG